MNKCPICGRKTFDYHSYKEDCWGAYITVEEHGYCDSCGYRLERAYSEPYEWFEDVKKGFKREYDGVYVKKDARKHKRNRKKSNVKGMDINPFWARYF